MSAPGSPGYYPGVNVHEYILCVTCEYCGHEDDHDVSEEYGDVQWVCDNCHNRNEVQADVLFGW